MPAEAWASLLALADRHTLTPLFYSRLTARAVPIPDAPRDLLRRAYLRSSFVNTQIHDRLAPLLAAMHDAGVPVIVLKGAYLAASVYPEPAQRPMSDVDLLIHADAMPRVYALTQSLGYAPRQGVPAAVPDEHSLDAHGSQLVQTGGLAVEWHWSIMHRPEGRVHLDAAELDGLWHRARPFTVGDTPAQALCPDDLLLHLCLHSAIDNRFHTGAVRTCFDVAAVIARHGAELDWATIVARARAWRIWHGVALALRLAHDWAGAEVPAPTLACVDETVSDPGLVAWLEARMHQPLPHVALRSHVPDALADSGRGGVVGGILRRLFPPRQIMVRNYPIAVQSWRLVYYYPWRLVDLTRRHGRTMWRLLTQDATTRALLQQEAALRVWLDQD